MTTPFLSLPGFLGSAALLSMAGLLHAQSVGSSSDYVNALTSINSAVTGSTGNSYSLEFGSGLAVTPGTGAFINAGTGNTVSINGNGGLLNGGNTLTPAVIFSGTVNLSNLTIQNGFGKGGDVSTNTFSRPNTGSLASAMPGGGAGLGGGLFIATSSVVTLHNVSFEANSTFGGVFRPTGFTNTHGGNASFVLGLENVDSNGVPTAGSGNQIAGNITDASNFSAILPPGTSAGGQQSLSYIAGSAPRSGGFGSAPQGTTGSTYDGAGTNGYVSDDFQGSAASAGQGKMGGGNGSFFLNTAHGSQVHTSAGGRWRVGWWGGNGGI